MATKRKTSIPLNDGGIDWSSPIGAPELLNQATEQSTKPEPQSGMLRRALGDTAVSAVKSAIGVPETFIGMADMVSGGRAGKLAEDAGVRFRDANAFLDSLYSPKYRAASKSVGAADGVVDTLKAAFENPSTIYHGTVTSLGSMLAGAPVGKAAMLAGSTMAGRAAMAAAPAAERAGILAATTRTPGWLAGAAAEGAASAGQNVEQVRQETKGGLLTPEQIAIVGASGALTAVITAVAGRIANNRGIGDLSQMIVGARQAGPEVQKGLARKLAEGFATEGVLQEFPQSWQEQVKGLARKLAKGFATEGVLQEFPQSWQEQVAKNIAQGKPWDQGAANAAVMGGLSGGLLGAGSAPFGHGSAPVVDPGQAIREKMLPDTGPMSRAANAAMAAQAQAASAGLPPLPTMTAEQGDKALAAIEAQGVADQGAQRMFGAGATTRSVASGAAPSPEATPAPEWMAAKPGEDEVPAPFGDRLMTVREQLGDDPTRKALRAAFGDDAVSRAAYFVNMADRPDVQIPDVTRDAMLATVEQMVQKATEPAATPAPVSEMPKPAPPEPAPRAERTSKDARSDGQVIDTSGPNAVAQFIAKQEGINTPAARAYVRDYRAGRVTDDEVLARVVGRSAQTPDERIAEAVGQAPAANTTAGPGDILNPDGKPFRTSRAASIAQKRQDATGSVIAVADGWVVRPKSSMVENADTPRPVGEATGASNGNQEQRQGQGRRRQEVLSRAGAETAPANAEAGNTALVSANQELEAEGFKNTPSTPNGWSRTVMDGANVKHLFSVREFGEPKNYRVTRSTSFPGTSVTGAPAVDLGTFSVPAQALSAVRDDLEKRMPERETGASHPAGAGAPTQATPASGNADPVLGAAPVDSAALANPKDNDGKSDVANKQDAESKMAPALEEAKKAAKTSVLTEGIPVAEREHEVTGNSATMTSDMALDERSTARDSSAADTRSNESENGHETTPDAQTADTVATETPDDSTSASSSPALNQPVAEGRRPVSEVATRGSRQPRGKPGRSDDRSVRDAGGLVEGLDDAGRDVGDRGGDAVVPDSAPADVEGSGSRVPAHDFRPAVGGLNREGSWFSSAERNLDLIDLARQIESENRPATPEEQARLSKYVGFGASEIRNALFPVPSEWIRKAAKPGSLIFPEAVYEARWKALAERAAALPFAWQRTILQSTQYAHYTSEAIIRSMWSGMQRLGFTGGKIFEPGGGIGSFAMLMPDAVRNTSKFTGIEVDGPTALIARLLSPQQNMLHDDFIKRRLPDNFFDVSVGNPPFAKTKITADPHYQKHGFMIHDYFFAKAIDKVRPGGLLAFVTSKGTMDKQSDKARRYLMDRADLLGAIRLPSTAFEGNAGTSVVTDVIFLRKRMPGDAPAGQKWAGVAAVETKDGPAVINEYFAAHPEMVLGQHRISGNTDDIGRRINSNGRGGEKYTVVSYDKSPEELDAKFAAAIERLPENVYSPSTMEPQSLRAEVAKMDFDPTVKREGVVYVGKDGELLRVEDGIGKPLSDAVKLSAKDKSWLADYVGVRDLVKAAQHSQVTDGAWESALKKLNKGYDAFVKKHGPINAFRVQVRKSTDEDGSDVETQIRIFTNRRLFREDYDSALMTQLETIDEDGKVQKAAFLNGRTIGKPVMREVKSIGDALAVSLDSIGSLNLDDVAARLHISRDESIEALGSQVYREPGGDWVLADEYLSGNVVEKLAQAIDAARLDPTFQRNVDALKNVQPEKLGPSQISVKLGAPWVDAKHVSAFAREIEAGEVTFDHKTETWQVAGGNERSRRRAGAEWGTAARSASELLEAALNSRSIKVMARTADKKEVVDQDATTAANEMAKKIKDKFKSWVWTDSERAADLVEAYNERYNNLAPRVFDGSHLTLPGVSLRYKLHPHQLRAIWRQIQTGNTYLAHAVGAGKTIEMIAGGMEQKRLGLIRKPIYVVPNHMLEQFSNEFMELYPLANIMVADDQNFSKERRKAFVAAATLNAPDAIVITHDAFQRIGVKEESVAPIRDEILADLEAEMEEAARDSGARVRRSQLQQQIEAVNQRFDSILAAGRKDGIVSFEDMGVDFVYADEAHTYRKLDFHTSQSIKGIDPNGSRRALDMYVKTRFLERQRPDRSMVFASGTAVTNTMGELFTIMRFFDPKTLDEGGISTFDSWARMFGDVASALEPNAAGKYEVVERFSKFDNVPELMSRVRRFMDVLQSDQLGAIVKRPDTRGGKPEMILVPPTQAMKEYQANVLQPRLDKSRAWKPSKDEPNNPDPVIAIITDGRFAATDPRFVPGGKVLPGESTKIDEAATRIGAEYMATADNEYVDREGKPMAIKGGTQIVFYNVGFGAAAGAKRGFNSRDAFTRRLVAEGVKRDHIVWFDDADTDAKKEAIFKGMRNGTYRVLIGSAKKMGTGVNVQNRLTELHYMDPPWYPADVEQPRGRIIRQGNQNAMVGEKWYATKGGYDSTMWQMVGRKQRFIDQAFRGDKNLRSMEDLGEASLYEQAAALASGDPRALVLAGLRQDVERLERQQAAHTSEQINARTALERARLEVESANKMAQVYADSFKAIGGGYYQFDHGTVRGARYSKQTEFGQALKDAFNAGAAAAVLEPGRKEQGLGMIGGLKLTMHQGWEWQKESDAKNAPMARVPNGRHELTVTAGEHTITVVPEVAGMGADVDALGLVRKIVNALNGIDSDLRKARVRAADGETDIVRLRKKMGAPFEHQQELLEKWAALKDLEEELRLEGLATPGNVPLDDGAPALESNNEAQTGNLAANESDVVFSRTQGQQAPASDRRQAVEALVALVAARWKSSPEVVVVDSLGDPDVPDAVRKDDQAQQSQGASGAPEGFFHDGKVYLVASQLGGDADVIRVLMHEALGHYGLRGVFGTELGKILDRVSILQAAKVRAKAKQYGLDYDKPSERRAAAEEVLSDMAQASPTIGWGAKAIAAVRTWLRAHIPGFNKMALTDDEIVRSYILPARQFVEHGRMATDEINPSDSPEQIKSAIGNRGTFDPAKADIRFSRSTIADMAANFNQAAARNAFLDAVTTHSSTNLWSRTVGTQYHKAQTHPTTFGPVFDAVQDYIKDTSVFASAAADKAPTLLPKLDNWTDLKKGGLRFHGANPADAAKAGEAIFRGTLDKELYDDATLAIRFGLTPGQIALYREFRAAVDESLGGMGKTEILRLAGADGQAVRGAVMAAPTLGDAAEILTDHLTELANRTANDDLLGAVASIGEKVARVAQLQGEGYAPLMRFGKHTLLAKDQAGAIEFFGMYESVREANQAARLMREDPEMSGMTFSQGVMSEQGHKLFNGLSLDSLELFADTIGEAENPVYQEYLKLAMSNRSALKRMIERKAIKGYSGDVARVLASFVTSNARLSAGHLHLAAAKKAAEAIPKAMGDLRDDAINLVEYVTNPAEEAAAVRGLLFTSFIGGSVASALVNLTQPITMTLPYLTQFGGVAKASARLLAAASAVASGRVGADMADALARAEADGIVSPQEIHHLKAAAMDSLGSKYPILKKAAFIWGSMFSLSEQFNRRVSFVAAYRTAQAEGMADPFKFAEQAVVESQGMYNKGNKANLARGAVGATVMTFKQFSTHYLEFLVRMWKSGPEGKKAVGVALALLMLTAGAGGLPFADDLDDMIDTLGQAMGLDMNAKRWKRKFIADTLGLGDTAAEVATRGLTAIPGMPIDLSLRMGMGNLLPATGLFLRSNTDTARQLLEVAGAAGALASNAKDGISKLLSGNAVDGALSVAPMAVQNMVKAIQMAQTGEYRNSKGARVMDVDGLDAAMKGIGFQPAAVASESARVGETMRSIALARNVENEIAGRWAQGLADHDAEAVASARQELEDWNKANPESRIKITMPQVLHRLKALRATRADRTEKAAPKELRQSVRETLH